MDTIVAGVRHRVGERRDYKITVFIDALGKTEHFRITKVLRNLGVQIAKVRGPRDESDPVIRLADSIAGLIRHAHEFQESAVELTRKAMKQGVFLAP